MLDLGEPVITVQANGSISKYNEYYLFNKEQELLVDETAVLMLERVAGFNEEVKEEEFFATVSVEGEKAVTVDLVPGIYKVSGFTTLNQEVVIPTEQRCYSYDIISWENEECFSFDENKMDKYVTGNLNWDLPENYLIITPEDLYTAKELTFYVLTQDILSIPMEVTSKAKKCSGWVCIPVFGCAGETCISEDL